MSDNTDHTHGRQTPNVPTIFADPSGHSFVSPIPSRDALSWSEFVKSQPQPDPAQVAAAQELAKKQRIEAAKAANQHARAEVRAYRAEVEKAVAAAAALKPGPPAPLHIRAGARGLLRGQAPRWGYGTQDPTLEALFMLQQRGEWLDQHLVGLDEAGRAELDVAETAAFAAMIRRARVVSGL